MIFKKYMKKCEEMEAQQAAAKAADDAATAAGPGADANAGWSRGGHRRAATIRFDVLTLFPDIFQGTSAEPARSWRIQAGLVQVHLWNIRDWAHGQAPEGGRPALRRRPRHGADAASRCSTASRRCRRRPSRRASW